MLDTKKISPAFLVKEEHAHYMNMCAIKIFTQVCSYFLSHKQFLSIKAVLRYKYTELNYKTWNVHDNLPAERVH